MTKEFNIWFTEDYFENCLILDGEFGMDFLIGEKNVKSQKKQSTHDEEINNKKGSLFRKESSNHEILGLFKKMGVKSADRLVNNFSKRDRSKTFYNNIIYTILISNMEFKKSRQIEEKLKIMADEEIKKHNKIKSVFKSSGIYSIFFCFLNYKFFYFFIFFTNILNKLLKLLFFI